MTIATIYGDADGLRSIKAVNHADTDIHCCAITTTLYNLAGWLTNNREHLYEEPTIEMHSGGVSIECKGDEIAQSAVEQAVIGLLQIQKKSPEAIKIMLTGVFGDES